MKKITATLIILLSYLCLGAVDFSQYDLIETQLEVMLKLEERGYSDEKLHHIANLFEKANRKPAEYIPPHTKEELQAVTDWATIAAFSAYAHFAGARFKAIEYNEDCPNRALFNFGRATGIEHLRVDVIGPALQLASSLQLTYIHDKDPEKQNFKESYYKQAARYGAMKYLEVIEK